MSKQLLRIQKKSADRLETAFRALCLYLTGVKSVRYDLKFIKSFLIPYLIYDEEIEPTVIKKANDFISFKFGGDQFLDIVKFLGGTKT